jgi:uncharacterized membrane protein YhaH (DUF805 family)
MRFDQAVATGFRKYADFTGRAGRPEFWWWILFTTVVNAALGALPVWPMMVWNGGVQSTGSLAGAWSIAVLVPTLAVTVRRLRDAGRHWGNVFWILLPLAGLIVLIVLCASPSVPAYREPAADAVPPVVPASKP